MNKNNISKPLVYSKKKLDYDELERMELDVVMARRGDRVLEFSFCHSRKIFSYKVYNTEITTLYYQGTDLWEATKKMNDG
jgi:hypothetical protein